jgi:phosphoribosyl-AMP cyclohydrolase
VNDAIEQALDEIKFGPDGLIAAIAQQHDTGEVLMLAWMNREAVRLTLAEGRACYWSRSRQALWRKGDTSGQIQRLVELRVDCDQDALLAVVEVGGDGGACHTGRRSCFYRAIPLGQIGDVRLEFRDGDKTFDPAAVYGKPD